MNFANVTDITIPEGNVVKIHESNSGRILWQRTSSTSPVRYVTYRCNEQTKQCWDGQFANAQLGITQTILEQENSISPSFGFYSWDRERLIINKNDKISYWLIPASYVEPHETYAPLVITDSSKATSLPISEWKYVYSEDGRAISSDIEYVDIYYFIADKDKKSIVLADSTNTIRADSPIVTFSWDKPTLTFTSVNRPYFSGKSPLQRERESTTISSTYGPVYDRVIVHGSIYGNRVGSGYVYQINWIYVEDGIL